MSFINNNNTIFILFEREVEIIDSNGHSDKKMLLLTLWIKITWLFLPAAIIQPTHSIQVIYNISILNHLLTPFFFFFLRFCARSSSASVAS